MQAAQVKAQTQRESWCGQQEISQSRTLARRWPEVAAEAGLKGFREHASHRRCTDDRYDRAAAWLVGAALRGVLD